jgi:uncharacterized YigZ family protein
MADEKYFFSVEKLRAATIKIKRSVFICTLEYVESMEQAKAFISRITKENKTANHNCWAYIMGEKAQTFHSSDAGEPSGTAGKPMLNTLQSHEMTNIAAVVTRHFGGVKLGVRGLIEAYGESVESAIALGRLKKLVRSVAIDIEVVYDFNDTFLNQMKNYSAWIIETAYTDKVTHKYEVEQKDYAMVDILLAEYQALGKLTYQLN